MNTFLTFIKKTNGVFERQRVAKTPLIADFYVPLFDEFDFYEWGQDKENLRNDLACFGEDFKKATRQAHQKATK